MFRRLLDTTLTAEGIYQRVVRAASTGLRRQGIHMLLDHVVLTAIEHVSSVSAFAAAIVTLAWRILEHQGSSTLKMTPGEVHAL
jgi:hypothetical protein